MFSGILISKDDAGQKVEVAQIDESQLPEGNVTVDVEYSTLNYKDGLLDGPCKEYYPSGKLESETNYKSGKRHGAHVVYTEAGAVEKRQNYKDDQLAL